MRLALIFLCLCLTLSYATFESYNFVLSAKKRECFFEEFKSTESSTKIEAFVLTGGNLDVVLNVYGPLQYEDIVKGTFETPVFTETIDATKESDSDTQSFVKEFSPESIGIYGICMDNRKSHFTAKTVQLSITPALRIIEIKEVVSGEKEEGVDPVKLLESLNALSVIHNGLAKIQLQQLRDRHRLDLHTEANITNYNNVMSGSIFETVIFICVAIFQIFFVRRWFTSKTSNTTKAKSWA